MTVEVFAHHGVRGVGLSVLDQIEEWHARYGARWKPSDLLREIAANGGLLKDAKGAGMT